MEYTMELLGRIAVTFVVLLVLTRLAGKKQLGQATFFDFISAISIGSIAGEKLSNPEEPLFPWIAGAALWYALIIAVDLVVLKNRKMGQILGGTASILIENGRIREKDLRANFVRVDDLMAMLRNQGYFDPTQIEFAILETDGKISVLPRSQYRPVTPKDLNLPTSYEGLARELIVDREVIHQNLRRMGLTEEWLAEELLRQGYFGTGQVFYAALNSQGKLYVDGYRDPGFNTKPNDYAH